MVVLTVLPQLLYVDKRVPAVREGHSQMVWSSYSSEQSHTGKHCNAGTALKDPMPLSGTAVQQSDNRDSCYGSRQTLTSPSDNVLCLMGIVHARFLSSTTSPSDGDEDPPVCVACNAYITVKHILIECADLVEVTKSILRRDLCTHCSKM